MKRFQFSLAKLLKLRSQETEQAKRALAFAMALEEAARQAAAEARERLRQRVESARQMEQGGLSAFDFGSLRSHLMLLQRQVVSADGELAAACATTARRRSELMEARQRERALEKLREKRLEQFNLEVLREEQKELDEFGNRPGLNSSASGADI